VPYLVCPGCEQSAWLDSTAEPPLRCPRCETPLAPMPARQARSLTRAVTARFRREMRLDGDRGRFVRR
jgi:hypothetical protein